MSTRLVVRALASVVTVTAVATAVAIPVVATIASASRRAGAVPVAADAPAPTVAPSATVAPLEPTASRAINLVVPEPIAARRVVLYGDSLGWESETPFVFALGAAGLHQVTTRTFGGTAICDWFDQMRTDATTIHPDTVVIEFSGNALTPCMKDGAGARLAGDAYFAKYTADTEAVLGIFHTVGATVYLVGTPIGLRAAWTHDPSAGRLNAIYVALAATTPSTGYIDAGAAVLDHGSWTHTLPCLPTEPCTGGRDATGTPVNVVRAPDGGHFCPTGHPAVRGITQACRTWSSGAWRFGAAMAAPVVADLTGHQE
jgi:hypothetical protein